MSTTPGPKTSPNPITNPDDFIGESTRNIQPDDKAIEETKSFVAQSRRRRREQNAMHWGYVCLIWIGVIAVSAVILIKVSHLVMPDEYSWLDEAHLKKLDEFLTSGVIGGTIVGAFKNKVAKE